MENTYIQLLRNAPKAKIIDLVNYIEGMPEQLKMTVKMHLKDDWMLDALDIKNERDLKLSRYSTLAKYFKDADDKTIAKDNAEVNWEKVKEFNKNASSFAEDYSKLNMEIYLCNDERNISEKEARKLSLEELKKWIKELKTE